MRTLEHGVVKSLARGHMVGIDRVGVLIGAGGSLSTPRSLQDRDKPIPPKRGPTRWKGERPVCTSQPCS